MGKIYSNICLLLTVLVIAVLSAACTDEFRTDNEEGEMVHVECTIGTRSYVDPEVDDERINTWWVALVSTSDSVVKSIVERDSTRTYAVEREGFELYINAGTYDVYTFANFDKATVEGLLRIDGTGVDTIAVGYKIPDDMDSLIYDVNSVVPNATLTQSLENPIPMSGKHTVTFLTSGKQQIDFEVVRMLAKMEFVFKNASATDLTVEKLSFKPINTGKVLLLPDTTLLLNNERDPVFPVGLAHDTVSKVIDFTESYDSDELLLPAVSYNTNSFTTSFYMRESLASTHPTNHFLMNMTINREGKGSEDILYTLTGTDFTGINRNDYVRIPIKFTDYIVKIEPRFYPPIGGYPPVVKEDKPEEFFIKFATEGTFGIFPIVLNAADGTPVSTSKYTYEITNVVDASPSIYAVPPHMDASEEIIGQLNTAEGTSCVEIRVTIDLGGGVSQVYDRRIYIIRENS